MHEIRIGKIDDASICDAVRNGILDCGAECVVLRSIDSIRTRKGILAVLDRHAIVSAECSHCVWISPDEFGRAIECNVFTGFDEIWLFKVVPSDDAITTVAALTSDSADLSMSPHGSLMSYLNSHLPIAILADGIGLNYVSTNACIMQCLRKIMP